MAQQRTSYPAEFRRRMLELVRAGRNSEELAKEFEPSAGTGPRPSITWQSSSPDDCPHDSPAIYTENLTDPDVFELHARA